MESSNRSEMRLDVDNATIFVEDSTFSCIFIFAIKSRENKSCLRYLLSRFYFAIEKYSKYFIHYFPQFHSI